MNIYLIDPLDSPIEVLFDNINKLFAIPLNDTTELNVMLEYNNLTYFAGELCFTHKKLFSITTNSSTIFCYTAEEFFKKIAERRLTEIL